MARYQLMAAVVGAPTGWPYGKYQGHSIADTAGNALPGDLVWPALTATPNKNQLMPLDSAAATAIGGTIGVFAGGALAGCDAAGAS